MRKSFYFTSCNSAPDAAEAGSFFLSGFDAYVRVLFSGSSISFVAKLLSHFSKSGLVLIEGEAGVLCAVGRLAVDGDGVGGALGGGQSLVCSQIGIIPPSGQQVVEGQEEGQCHE